jgi:hypothetical protein
MSAFAESDRQPLQGNAPLWAMSDFLQRNKQYHP